MMESIGFLGAGSMAEAIIKGIVQAGVTLPENIHVTNRRSTDRLEALHSTYGVHIHPGDVGPIAQSSVVVVAPKPKDAQVAIEQLRATVRPQTIVVSVMAGVSTRAIERWFGIPVPIVRAMPNTSSAVREGMTAIAPGQFADGNQLDCVATIFRAIGDVAIVDEDQMDAVTAVSGSGPAYVYRMVEHLISAGIAEGLSEEVATQLAISTIVGAGAMLRKTGQRPDILRNQVTSPNGTTMAGLDALEREGFGRVIREAVRAAAHRSAELGKPYEEPGE